MGNRVEDEYQGETGQDDGGKHDGGHGDGNGGGQSGHYDGDGGNGDSGNNGHDGEDNKKIYDAEGDPQLRAMRRPIFDRWKTDGIEVNDQTFVLNEHAYKSLFKSGRKDIMPDDLIEALSTEPQPANPGSVKYLNPFTGTRVYVNPTTSTIVGISPIDFKSPDRR